MYVQNDVRVTIRVDKELKESAENLFARLGMNMTTAFNVFLRKAVAEEAIPFPVNIKKATFGAGYTPADITGAFATVVREDMAEYRRGGFPVARYDAATGRAYLESPDGTREYIDD